MCAYEFDLVIFFLLRAGYRVGVARTWSLFVRGLVSAEAGGQADQMPSICSVSQRTVGFAQTSTG